MSSLFVRCDASLSIGSGHVMRCRNLAFQFLREGYDIIFISRMQPGDLIDLLKLDFEVLVLPELTLQPTNELKGRKLYAAWLGCTQYTDARECIDALESRKFQQGDILLVDHYGLDIEWEIEITSKLVNSNMIKLVVIDDLADRPHHCDILIDQNLFDQCSYARYSGLTPINCLNLFGPKYALLRPEYAHLHPIIPTRRTLLRVFIFFGGVDKYQYTLSALDVLLKPEFSSLSIDVALGAHFPNKARVHELSSSRTNIFIHPPLPSLAGLISRSDIGIGAGGSTCWERACLGLPSLILPVASNQYQPALALCNYTKMSMLSSSEFSESLYQSLDHLLSTPEILCRSSILNSKLLDGRGCRIVFDEVQQFNEQPRY